MVPQVTILMPTYNGAFFLKEAIDSVLQQTFKDFELLIINDCSPDNTDEIVNSYNDPRIRYVKNEKNLGISGSSNYGISIAKGKYIARQDHDDLSHPERLEKQVNYMETHPEVGICGTGYHIFGRHNRVVIHPQSDGLIKSSLLFKCTIAHQTSIIRKSLFTEHNLRYDETFVSSNDRKLWIDAAPYTQFHNIPKVLLEYRMHKGMTSKTKRDIVLQEGRRLRDLLYQILQINLSPEQLHIIDTYLMQGRAHITDKNIIRQIDSILRLFIQANNQSQVFDDESFRQVCGQYFQKRCLNYSFFAKRPTTELYYSSPLSAYNALVTRKYRWTQKILNFMLFWRK